MTAENVTVERVHNFCATCGAKLAVDANFCSSCGSAIAAGVQNPARTSRSRMVAGSVFAGFLVVGTAAYFSAREASTTPTRTVPGRPTTGAAPAGQPLPPEHPPIELPSEAIELLAELTKEAESKPEDLVAWQRLARGRYRAALIDPSYVLGAKEAIDRVLKIDPDNLEALRTRGNLAYDRREYADAERYLERFLELDPGDPGVKTDLASSLLFQGDRESAKRLYREVIAANPDFVQAHLNLGIALHADGDAEAAEASLEEALARASTPEQKEQVERIISLAANRAEKDRQNESPPTKATSPFQRDAEASLRGHPIIGPKIVSVAWNDATRGRVTLKAFPMDAMPPVMLNKFKSRINAVLAQSADANGAGETIEIELVDADTGTVMDKLDGKEWVGAFDEIE
jgi:Flp pilus assembly protein TadD